MLRLNCYRPPLPLRTAVKAVLFDLDDTLFDHRYAARCVLQEFQMRWRGLGSVSLEFLEEEDFRLLTEKHARVLAGSLSLDESRWQRIQGLFGSCGVDIGLEDARKLVALRQKIYRRFRRPVPGALALLQELKPHVRTAVVTNNFTAEQQGKIDACGLTGLIDDLVTSEETHSTKPQPEIFNAALERAGCRPAEAVMVGDSWDTDVTGALNAGIRAVWLNRNGSTKPLDDRVTEIKSLEPADLVAEVILGRNRC